MCKGWLILNRATRLGELGPIWVVLKITELTQIVRPSVFHVKSFLFEQNMIFGDFFTNPSGHPGPDKKRERKAQIFFTVCTTDLQGPTPFSQCIFPFEWEGKQHTK
jgi:hypothetical protein